MYTNGDIRKQKKIHNEISRKKIVLYILFEIMYRYTSDLREKKRKYQIRNFSLRYHLNDSVQMKIKHNIGSTLESKKRCSGSYLIRSISDCCKFSFFGFLLLVE